MSENLSVLTYFVTILIISRLLSVTGDTELSIKPLLPPNLLELNIAGKLRTDPEAIESASHDYGHIVKQNPGAVLYPASITDITTLIKFAYNNSVDVAAKGCAHSVRGQAMAFNGGVVVDMTSLSQHFNGTGIVVSGNDFLGFFADVGGEQRWIDVLNATLEHGLAPVSWTDYLHITVGGTLSNAGISGQTFRFGPQISNVYELDVITGKGEFVTCSRRNNSDLFYAVLGGLGQFGIITRARIVLAPAPKRVKWVRMLYSDFSAFSRDQERLISFNGRGQGINVLDYVEGSLIMNQGNWWRSSFPQSDLHTITSLVIKNGILYSLEVSKNYDDHSMSTIDQELEVLLKDLSYVPGLKFEQDVPYFEFINRVSTEEQNLRSKGLWDVPHPWLNLFIPKSRIMDFDSGVFKDIVLKRNITTGLVLLYPMNHKKWDDRMSAVIPEEETFYTVGFLHSSGFNDWKAYDDQNQEILSFCDKSGIKVKQYLGYHTTKEDWINHFGSKWRIFQQRKERFDPKKILSPGQRIFNSLHKD